MNSMAVSESNIAVDIMAGRKSYGKVEGKLLYDQQQPSNNFLRNSVGYVEQFGMLLLLIQ